MVSGILNLLTNSRIIIFNNSLSKFYSLFNLILFIIFFFRINRPMNLRFCREIYLFVFSLLLSSEHIEQAVFQNTCTYDV